MAALLLTHTELGDWGVANPPISSEALDVPGRSSSPKLSCFPVFISSHPKLWVYCDFQPFFSGCLVLSCPLRSGGRSHWQQELPVLRLGLWEVPAAALLCLSSGDRRQCHCATAGFQLPAPVHIS